MRASGSAALNYGEAQGTVTDSGFIHKMSFLLKELKETSVALKVLDYVEYGDDVKRQELLEEAEELCRISAKMIINKKTRSES
jgi:four helix bundle protein